MEKLEQKSESIDMVKWLDQMPLTATMEVLNQVKENNSDGRWNGNDTYREIISRESIPEDIEWESVVPTIKYDNVPMLDEDLVREYGLLESLQTKKQLYVSKIWKVWKEIYINQQFKVVPKRNSRWEKYYTIWQNIWWMYHEMDSSELSSGGYRGTIYEDLNRKYFS